MTTIKRLNSKHEKDFAPEQWLHAHLWWAWCRRCSAWRRAPRSSPRSRACHPWRWSAGRPGRCCSWCRWSTPDARARSCKSHRQRWWSAGEKMRQGCRLKSLGSRYIEFEQNKCTIVVTATIRYIINKTDNNSESVLYVVLLSANDIIIISSKGIFALSGSNKIKLFIGYVKLTN